MALGKKAYFFSITVLLLIGVAALIMSSTRDPGFQRSANLANQRLNELQLFMNGIEKDATSATYVATYRSLLTAHDIIQGTGALANPEDVLAQLIIDGQYNGIEQPLLSNESLEAWVAHLQPLAHHLRVTIVIVINEVIVTQEDPWHVTTITNATIHAHDNYTDSSWQYQFITKAKIPLDGITDPLYTIGSDGRYTQIITPTLLPINDFSSHIDNHYYITSTDAPSYLDRLAGSTSSSLYGIESLVKVDALSAVNVNYQGSIIDWQYFGTNEVNTCSLPGGLPGWAVIGQAHMIRYGLPTC